MNKERNKQNCLIKFLVYIVVASIMLLGCPRKEQPKVTKKIVLNMWIMPNSPKPVQDLEDVLSDFKKEHPEIDIIITCIDWGAAWTKLTTAATSGIAPDICQIGSTWVGAISAMGALLPLNDRISELGGSDAFLPAIWETAGIENSGIVTAIPWFVDVRALYYRTDIFKKLGLTTKDLETWESFEKTLEKIKQAKVVMDKNGNMYYGEEGEKKLKEPGSVLVAPLGIPGKNDWNVVHNFAPWIWSAGGDWLSRDRTTSILNSEEVLKGALFYTGLVTKGYVPKSCLELNSAQIAANFYHGEYAITFDGPWAVKYLRLPPEEGGSAHTIAAKNYDVALFPKGPAGRVHFFGGSNLAIFKVSKHPNEAWKVIKYLCSKEAQIKYADKTGFLPSRIDAFDDPFFDKDPQRKVFKRAVKYGRAYPCIAAWGPVEPILTRRLGILWDYVVGVYGFFDPARIKEQLEMAKQEVDVVLKTK